MGKYSISIDKTAQKELQEHYKSGNKPLIKKIEQIFEELTEHPETGTGKPEILKYNLSGSWSRRLNGEHRIVYKITDDRVLVSSAKDHY